MSTVPSQPARKFQVLASPDFSQWLEQSNTSLAFSTYQLGKIFFVGLKEPGRIGIFERTFNRCMGLWSDTQTLWLASAFQLWRMENTLEPGGVIDGGFDRLYVPKEAITTGDIDVHDLAMGDDGELFFVNTLFGCIAKLSSKYSFDVYWRPPFISQLAAEDRCHLNGLTCKNGKPKYVTACAKSDRLHGWRDERQSGGCVIDIESNEIIADGFSMPHSPRIYNDRLWLLDSGNGYFGYVDTETGKFERQVFCPGYARGLCFIDKYAVVGLSKPREKTFSGLALDEELKRHNSPPCCGLLVIDLESGKTVHSLFVEGTVEELYDVIALPQVRRPKAFGLKTDEIRHNVWFEQNGKVTRWSAAGEAKG